MIARAALLTSLLALSLPARGVEVLKTNRFAVGAGELRAGQVLVMSQEAEMAGTLADDAFLFTQVLKLTGAASNDLWAAGGELTVDGSVADHLRAAANHLSLGGRVGSDITAAAATLQISSNATIGGSAMLFAESATLEGHIAGDLTLMAEQVTLAGRIDGKVRLLATDIVVMPGTVIGGDLVYTSGKELILDPKVAVGGEVRRAEWDTTPAAAPSPALRLVNQTALFLGSWLTGALVLLLFPAYIGRAARHLRHSPARCGFAGAIAFCLMPMLAVLIALTIIGLPLAALLAGAFAALLYLAKLAAGLALGSVLLRWSGGRTRRQALGALTLGLALLYGAMNIPGIGQVIWTIVAFLGGGALVLALMAERPPALPVEPPQG